MLTIRNLKLKNLHRYALPMARFITEPPTSQPPLPRHSLTFIACRLFEIRDQILLRLASTMLVNIIKALYARVVTLVSGTFVPGWFVSDCSSPEGPSCGWFVQRMVRPADGSSSGWFVQRMVRTADGSSSACFIQRKLIRTNSVPSSPLPFS